MPRGVYPRKRTRTDEQVRGRAAERMRERRAAAAATDPRFHQRRHLKQLYGITLESYDRMWDEQGGLCAICGQAETKQREGVTLRLSVDHNHETGAVRALLCANCNLILGNAKESATVLRLAADYLEEHNGR